MTDSGLADVWPSIPCNGRHLSLPHLSQALAGLFSVRVVRTLSGGKNVFRLLKRLKKKGAVHPSPVALHPSPMTLHPTPMTLHPCPITLHPSPMTLHSCPTTLHPSPITLHPSPTTLHPSPVALHSSLIALHSLRRGAQRATLQR